MKPNIITHNILIIDDVPEMLELIRLVINKVDGMKVSGIAKNGWEARLELERRRPDLILLDEILPGESAIDLLREFHTQGIPVLMITGMKEPSHEIPTHALGRLIKPGWNSVESDQKRFQNKLQDIFKK